MSISLPLNTALITMPEKEQIKLQTDDSYWAEEKRILACYKRMPTEEKVTVFVDLVFQDMVPNIAKGVTASVVVGAPAFGFFGLVIGGIPGLIGGLKLGAALGVAGGLADGALVGIREVKIKFMSSNSYKEWTSEARKTDVYPIYQKIIQNDPRFEEYICHFTSDLICIPVRAPDGMIYEQANIVEWIKIKEDQIKKATDYGASKDQIDAIKETLSPIRANVKSFSENDLRYHLDYFTGLDKLAKIKISEMEDQEEKRIFGSATQAILRGHIQDRKHIIKEQMFEVQRHVRKHKLDPSISQKVTEKLMQELDRIEEQESNRI